jgi:hypothetical protein
MTDGNGSASIARETNARFDRLVTEELQSVIFDKERYDFQYPGHAIDLAGNRLRHIARERVLTRLCAPFCDERVEGCGEELF